MKDNAEKAKKEEVKKDNKKDKDQVFQNYPLNQDIRSILKAL